MQRPSPLLLVFRALVLYTNFDVVCIPNYELQMGNMATHMVEGWRGAPLVQYYDNCGGHLATGVLAAPAYFVMGGSYLALKMVPLFLGLGSLIALWALLARYFDRRAADIAALAFVLGPPTLTKFSMMALGNHFENLLWQLLAWNAFYAMHRGEHSNRRVFLFGLASGFAVFFYFGSLALLMLFGIMHLLIRGPRATLRDVRFIAAGFVIGFSPMIVISIANSGRTMRYFSGWLAGGKEKANSVVGERATEFFTDILPNSPCFEALGPITREHFDLLFLGLFAVSWLFLLPSLLKGVSVWLSSWRGDGDVRAREKTRFDALILAPLLAYLPLVAAIYSFGALKFDRFTPPEEVGQYRYLVPHFLIALMIIGVAARRLVQAGGWRRYSGFGLTALLLLTGLGTLPIVDWSFAHTNMGPKYRGDIPRYYTNIAMKTPFDVKLGLETWDHAEIDAYLAEFDPRDRHEAYIGMGHYLAWAQTYVQRRAKQPLVLNLRGIQSLYPEHAHMDLAIGAGTFLRKEIHGGEADDAYVRRSFERLLDSGGPYGSYVAVGLSLEYEYTLARHTREDLRRSAKNASSVRAAFAADYRRGLGDAAGRLLARGIESDVGQALAMPGSLQTVEEPDFWFGVGMAFGRDADTVPERFDEWVPDAHRRTAWMGFGAGMRHSLGLSAAGELFKEQRRTLKKADSEAYELGLRWTNYPAPFEL